MVFVNHIRLQELCLIPIQDTFNQHLMCTLHYIITLAMEAMKKGTGKYLINMVSAIIDSFIMGLMTTLSSELRKRL